MAVAKTCKYVCNGIEWELVSGTAPEGYYCVQILGGCDDPGAFAMFPPAPIPPPAMASPEQEPENSGEYQFDVATDSLYFSRGSAEKGFRILSTISMSELREKFPAIAAEVELMKKAKSLVRFTVTVPAIRLD